MTDRETVDPVKIKGRASYTELADFARRLHQAAQILSDSFERNVDGYVFTGGMWALDNLDEILRKAVEVETLAAIFYSES